MRIRTEIEFPKNKPKGISIHPRRNDIWNIQEELDNVIPTEESYLYPNTRNEHFRCMPLVSIKKDGGEPMRRTIRVVPEYLPNDIEFMRVRIFLLYDDKLGANYEKEIIDEIWPVKTNYSLNRMIVEGREYDTEDEDPYDKIRNSINTRRMQGASEETIKQKHSPIYSMFFSNQLDENRIEVNKSTEGGFGFSIELDDDYKEELKDELEQSGVRDEIFFEYEDRDEDKSDK